MPTVSGELGGAGTLIGLDGTGGEVVVGEPGVATASTDPQLRRLLSWGDRTRS
ncbi:hypothetical protein [Streptomyces sp. bgisy029]|uniref:hypothetical protein n=1 Tax=Streptomyces sp. bgisy029 TaxID=3413771 RepID=UPI003D73D7D2